MLKDIDDFEIGPVHGRVFSDSYLEEAFLLWYQSGRPNIKAFMNTIPKDELGRIPNYNVILDFRRRRHWDERADELDVEVAKKIETLTVEAKVKMFERHAAIAKKMVEAGEKYFNEHPSMENVHAAIKAVVEGTKIERESRGIPDALLGISNLSDQKLLKTIERLMSGVEAEKEKETDNEAIEGDFVEDDLD